MKKLKYLLFMIPILIGFMNNVKADEITTYKHQAGYRTDTGELIWTGYISGSRNLIIEDPYNSYIPQYYDWSFNANVTNGYMYNVSYELLITYPYNVTSNYFTYKKYISYIDFNNIQSNFLSQSSCQISSIDNPSDYSERFTISCKFISNASGNYEYIHVLRINTSKTIDNLANGINIVPAFTGTSMFVDYKISNWSFEINQDSYNNQIIIQGDKEIQQNQTIIEQNNQTNEKLDDLEDTITDDSVTGVEDSFQQFEGFLEENSTITQLITLPITLYSSILNNVGGTCQPFNLGSLYGENLILPCINIGDYLGSTLWGMIDLIISGFSVYFISKKLIKVFNNFSSMKDGDVIDD